MVLELILLNGAVQLQVLVGGMAGAAVDAGGNVYENRLYDDTIKYFTDLNKQNASLTGIDIVAKN